MLPDKTRNPHATSQHPATDVAPKAPSDTGARAQILAAAAELAREKGAAHISIEAIAKRAGLSKGGLLYHFPRKDALLQALVEQHMAEVDAVLAEIESANSDRRTNAIARAVIVLAREKVCQNKDKLEGIILAFAENPHLLAPVRAYEKQIAERIRRTACDPELSLIALLVIEGMRSLDLFSANPLTTDECTAVLDRLMTVLADDPDEAEERGTR